MLWFGHGRSGYRMLLEQDRHHDLHMDALVLAYTRTLNSVVYAIFRALEALHIRRGRPSMHYLHFYTLPQLRTMIITVVRVGSQTADTKHGFIKL